ncbi:MAG TPA: TMEM175 family protein [Fimbriimonadaceae bacterium]|nr:TMEM175 family protein [Fimbriimonadaceae bacterium]
MTKGRIEAFSDAVIAIILTIMVLELKVPHDSTLEALKPLFPTLLSYVLSFLYLGIYWNNHHHLFQAVKTIRGGVLWANLHLLFWLSLVPFVTSWMGENHFAPTPTAMYGVVLLGAAIGYSIMVHVLLKHHDSNSILARAIGQDAKGHLSLFLYCVSIFSAFFAPVVAGAIYLVVALIWLVPDRRIERIMEASVETGRKVD